MYTIMKFGAPGKEVGFIYLNHNERKIEKIDIQDNIMKGVIIGIREDNYNYLKLENQMKYMLDFENTDKNLKFITDRIKTEGFVYPLNPSIIINIEEVDHL